MNIRAEDIQKISGQLEEQQEMGNTSAVYVRGLLYTLLDEIFYFKTENYAMKYWKDHENDFTEFREIKIRPLLDTIQNILQDDSHRQDIAFYEINNNTFEVSRTLKTDQAENLSESSERNVLRSTGNHPTADPDLLKHLSDKLKSIGIEENLYEILEQNIRQGHGYIEITLHKEFETDKMRYQLRFEKDVEYGYSFSGYEVQLFHYAEIEHTSINGIDTSTLSTRMKNADWYYEYSDDYQVWEKGRVEIENIKSNLKQLSNDNNGALVAVQLWNNHVPLYSINKPEFIHTTEEKHGLYPARIFSPEIHARKAYANLKANNLNTSLNNTDMNQKNYDYLKDQVKFTGFGDSLENELKEKMKQQLPEFTLQHQRDFGKDNAIATLHFKKPENAEVHFFNRYDLSVKQPNNEEAVNQTFYIGRENNFTLKEAYNLLAGRAVYKELNKLEKSGEGETAYYRPTDEKYNAWVQLDFKNTEANGNFKMKYYHDNYGFDLKAKLAEYPIKEMNNEEERKSLLQSLEKGNRQSVIFIRDGKEQKQFIEASPQYKSLNIYDGNNKRIRKTQKQDENTNQQGQKKSKKEKQEQTPGEEESGPKRSRKVKQGIS